MSTEGNNEGIHFLGIDIGTTSVKVCLIDAAGVQISLETVEIHTLSSGRDSDVIDPHPHEHSQCPLQIIEAIDMCLQRLGSEVSSVARIGISGQMHGVCFWKYESSVNWNVSRHYTWMDRRCDAEFLKSLPDPMSHLKLSSGYGCATLFWFARNHPEVLALYDSAGTIMDFVVAYICDLPKPVMSPQNGASWGYFDTSCDSFNHSILKSGNFPVHLLPSIQKCDSIAGNLRSNFSGLKLSGLKPGTPVGVGLGDLQCGVYAALSLMGDPYSASPYLNSAFLSISTSAQIAYVTHEIHEKSLAEFYPYFNGTYLAVGASLNGGNILALYVEFMLHSLTHFGLDISRDALWTKMLKAGFEVKKTSLEISPLLFSERYLPHLKANVANTMCGNLKLGDVMRATCAGLVRNLTNFISLEELELQKISTLVGTGSALCRNEILKEEVREQFKQFNVVIREEKECCAAFGVANFQLSESKIQTSLSISVTL